ncbi:MAG: pyridoxamine 5'-phosphate oxidase family protein [Pedobacter sp.]
MDLKDYFEKTTGTGVLATADAQGRVDAAIYARPHILEDGTAAFIMLDRLTHKNLQTNPHATFLFMEKGEGYRGVRLFLKKLREDTDPELIESLSRRCVSQDYMQGTKFLVVFELEKILNLLGPGTPDIVV